MKRARERKGKLLLGILALALALGIGLFGEAFSLVAYADSQGRITASSAKIRRNPTVNSDMVSGAQNGEVLTVTGQVQGDDGYTWWKVVKGDQEGYVRGDLISVSDAPSVPSEGTDNPVAPTEVTQVNPVAATVKEANGRIRSEASVAGQILAEVANGAALTITGQATDGEGKLWYQVLYLSGETQVEGFIRADYVDFSGELTPATDEPSEPEPPSAPEPVVEVKKWDTALRGDGWYVYDTETMDGWSIAALLDNASSAVETSAENEKTMKSQKIIIIILVFLLVAAVAAIAYLVYKIRDMSDSAYYNAVENDTIRKRNASGSKGGQKVMHSVGMDKQPAKPVGTRPAGTSSAQRPSNASQGQRPAGTSQGQRSAGASQSQRPAGTSQGQRPAGTSQGQRPMGAAQGQRPAGTSQGARFAGTSQGQRPEGAPQGQRSGAPSGTRTTQASQGGGSRSQPKNFMVDDDEFEYEYLNYDGDDRQ